MDSRIELNGKLYDAKTGQPVASAGQKHHSKPGRTMDGVLRKPSSSIAAVSAIQVEPAAVSIPPVRPVMDIAAPRRPKAHHISHRQPASSKTLARSGVQRPGQSFKRAARPVPALRGHAPKPLRELLPKISFDQIDEARLKRAEKVVRHRLVNRFGYVEPPVHRHAAAPRAAAVRPTAAPSKPHPDIFEAALRAATSHEQPAVKRRRGKLRRVHHRPLSIAAAVLAMLLIGGFIAYQNQANIHMYMAAAKAGFPATLPAWKPSGFAAREFHYSPGSVTVGFNDGASKRHFSLSEKPSTMNTGALLNTVVAARTDDYQTYQSAGLTVYIYGNNNAAWVNGGVEYQLTSDGSLSTDQLLHLASTV